MARYSFEIFNFSVGCAINAPDCCAGILVLDFQRPPSQAVKYPGDDGAVIFAQGTL